VTTTTETPLVYYLDQASIELQGSRVPSDRRLLADIDALFASGTVALADLAHVLARAFKGGSASVVTLYGGARAESADDIERMSTLLRLAIAVRDVSPWASAELTRQLETTLDWLDGKLAEPRPCTA